MCVAGVLVERRCACVGVRYACGEVCMCRGGVRA